MSIAIAEALADRFVALAKARAIHDRVGPGREPSGEDRAEFDRLMTRAELLGSTARKEEAAIRRRPSDPPLGPLFADPPQVRDRLSRARDLHASPMYRSLFFDWMVRGTPIDARVPAEYRDVVLSDPAKGGYLVAPVALANRIVRLIDDMTWIRSKATVVVLRDGQALGVPQITTNFSDGQWSGEVAPVTEDVSMVLSMRDLEPKLLSKLVKASMHWMAVAGDADLWLADQIGYAIGITEEKAYMNGSGTDRPLGIFVASDDGIPTSRDISEGNTSTTIGADNLPEMRASLKSTYKTDPSLAWLFSREALRQISLLKDTAENYIFRPATVSGEPDRLLGIPAYESEFVPSVFTTGMYVGALAAWRYYFIAEYESTLIQRVTELYSHTNEIGLIARRFVDGAAVVGEAFARSKLAAP